MKLKLTLFIISLLLGLTRAGAQNIEYTATVDTNYMLIGDQQYLTFKVKSDPGVKVVFPLLKDTVTKGVEIISGPVRDSVKESDGRWLVEEKYVITAFDSGMYVIPSMPIRIEMDNYDNILNTEPFGFVVNTFDVDRQKGNYDIEMPYSTPWNFAEILPYLLWTLLGIVVIALVWWYVVRLRKNKPLFVPKEEKIPPFVKAIRQLDEIKSQKLWQAGREKEYYTRLTDTVRQYLDDEFRIPAMEQTSVETIRTLEGFKDIDGKDKDNLSEMLQTADYVKFAKFTPLQDENSRYLDRAYDFLNHTNQKLEQEKAAEDQRQETEQKEPD